MNKTTFEAFRRIVYSKAGISINENKVALVTARVGKRMRELGITNEKEYLALVQDTSQNNEIVHLLDVISTNVTSFFRESEHFDFFADVFRSWIQKGQNKFRFWSAASSTGEEPYSLAMTILDTMNGRKCDVRILATDISTRVLEKASLGQYTEDKINPIPDRFKHEYLYRVATGTGTNYQIKKHVRNLISFSRINLSQTPFPMKGPMDAIFCRNVMIYFDNTVRQKLLEEVWRLLKPGGYFFVGHAESLTGLLSNLKSVSPSVYVKPF